MQLKSFFAITFFAIIRLSFISVAEGAAVVRRAPEVVWCPTIISPSAATIWKSKTEVNVTWDHSNPPASISNRAKVELHGGPTSINQELADNFVLTQGWISVSVPVVPSGNDYTITLFGDSGNVSPKFTILNEA